MHVKSSDEQLDKTIHEYASKNNIKLVIMTPCYGGQVFMNYCQSLMETKLLFIKYNILLDIKFICGDSLVTRVRNNLIAHAMSDASVTHLMFIDSDIVWNAMDIIRLIITDKEVIGGAYPKKENMWNKLLKEEDIISKWLNEKKNLPALDFIQETDWIQHKLLNYNLNYLDHDEKVENNLIRVKHVATGFMMFKRQVIEKMIEKYPETRYCMDSVVPDEDKKYAHAIFDCFIDNELNYLSGDWAFCDRWIKMNGDIWIDVSIGLTHIGRHDYKGFYLSTIL